MNWQAKCALAERVVAKLRRSLPPEVRDASADLPFSCWPRPTKSMRREGLEPDLLGLFVGPALGESWDDGGGDPLPSEILLFLDNLWDEAGGDPDAFAEEIRITYLHELGHFLGLDEDEVAERGLE